MRLRVEDPPQDIFLQRSSERARRLFGQKLCLIIPPLAKSSGMKRDREHNRHITKGRFLGQHPLDLLSQAPTHLRPPLQEEDVGPKDPLIRADISQAVQHHPPAPRAVGRRLSALRGMTSRASSGCRGSAHIGPTRGARDPIGERVHGFPTQDAQCGKDKAQEIVGESAREDRDGSPEHDRQLSDSSENGFWKNARYKDSARSRSDSATRSKIG